MPSDPENLSEAQFEPEADPEVLPEEEAPSALAKPRCPHCGWQNVRITHDRRMLDTILAAAFSIHRFKCRTCGRYFRHWYRSSK